MVITYILAGALAGAIIAATHYRREMKKSDRIVGEMMQDKMDFIARTNSKLSTIEKSLREEKKSHSETCAELRCVRKLLLRGHENLQVRDKLNCGIYGFVQVCGMAHESNEYFIIKQFEYDSRDPEGRDFAVREAEELIETINKA